MKHKVVQSAFNVREKLAPVRSTSGFEDHGVLTPEEARASTHTRTRSPRARALSPPRGVRFLRVHAGEPLPRTRDAPSDDRARSPRLDSAQFVAAGDQLVASCPTWQWAAGDARCARPYLPPEKQYLITRNVPCRSRVDQCARAPSPRRARAARARARSRAYPSLFRLLALLKVRGERDHD